MYTYEGGYYVGRLLLCISYMSTVFILLATSVSSVLVEFQSVAVWSNLKSYQNLIKIRSRSDGVDIFRVQRLNYSFNHRRC